MEINFTPGLARELRKAFDRAKGSGEDRFTWEGHEFVTDYAYYLLIYLSQQFNDESLSPEGGK